MRTATQPDHSSPSPAGNRAIAGTLPAALTSLIGREPEIAAACALLRRDDVRLVTCIGPGGVGKTQLALAVARTVNDVFADGTVFVSLAPLSDPTLVVSAIAQALDVRDSGKRPLIDVLRLALRERELLLLLDNFEHVLPATPLVVDLLTACPGLKVLVTSRELLHLSGEHAVEVPPLALPDPTPALPVDELRSCAAIHLFVTRAQEAKPDFALTDTNAGAVTAICRTLDGLPLALELAAARMRVLAPSDLLKQLTNRLQLLTGGHRDAAERLQTMRQAIAWSDNLLNADEQRVFRSLSVFIGGFTLEAAAAITPDSFSLDVLASLVDKSLVQQEERSDGETRFSLLETIREYGQERLAASGEGNDLRARHAHYYLAVAEQADQFPATAAKVPASRQFEAELPNIRVALAWAENARDAELMLRLVLSLWWYWESRGSVAEASAWADRAIEATVAARPELRGQRAQLFALAALGSAWRGAHDRAANLVDDAASLAQAADDFRASAIAAYTAGHLAIWREEWDLANTYLTDAHARLRVLGETGFVVGSLYLRGWIASLHGEYEVAAGWFAEGLAEAQAADFPAQIAFGLEALGYCAHQQGNQRRAASLVGDALSIVQDGSDLTTLADCLKTLGAVAAVTGDAERAARLFGAAEALREHSGISGQPAAEQTRLEQDYAPARARLSPDEFAAAWAAGRKLPLKQAIAEALEVAGKVISVQPSAPESPAGLTPRELAVLRLLVEGLSDKEIADTLGMSRRTASKHVESILAKFNVASRTAAATYATRHGVVDAQPAGHPTYFSPS